MAATIKDVARRARVSIASVSRALNSSASVTPGVRSRVLRAARKLHYMPHAAARSLINRRTHTVGLLLPEIHGEYFSELIRGVDRAARARGLHLLVSSSHGDTPEAMDSALRSMNGRVDGLLLMSPHVGGGSLAAALPPGLPTVLMNTRVWRGMRAAYLVDDFGGARAMASHLVACGYRRIAHIRGPRNNFDAEERLRGFRAGLRTRRARVIEGDFTEESGYRAGQAIAAASARPDAVFAANDAVAIGCLFALTEAGVRVPQDIALAGFDDIPVARFVHPPLTTVRVDVAAMGRRALDRLAGAIADPRADSATVETVPVELVIRASCGAAPRRCARERGA